MVRSIVPAVAILALAGCSPGDVPRTAQANGHSPRTPAATPIGPAQSCIPLGQISESRVRDDWTIDFRVGSRWYRNTLPQRCNGLGFQQTFGYATSQTQLCSVDIITVLQTGPAGGPRGSCGLGSFQPVTLAK